MKILFEFLFPFLFLELGIVSICYILGYNAGCRAGLRTKKGKQ